MNFWPPKEQTYLLIADGENNQVRIVRRSDDTIVGHFGQSGRNAGEFHWVHVMAVDSHGNVYTGEVDNAKRIQRFHPAGAL
jgi:sugar lactone lactonase YvrE